MPTVEATTWIAAPLELVYAIAKENEKFPDYMADAESVTIVDRDGDRVVSDWVGIIRTFGRKVKWRQEDVWDDDAKTCTFRQIEGDYDSMSGTWRFEDKDGGTQFTNVMDYEYRVPGLGALVAKVVHALVAKNIEAVLAAIKEQAEKQKDR